MSNVRFDELELMLMAMFEQPTLKDTIQVLTEVQSLVAEDAEMAALVQQTIPKMQRLNEHQSLPDISEHGSENKGIGQCHKPGRIHFVVGRKTVHFDIHLKWLE